MEHIGQIHKVRQSADGTPVYDIGCTPDGTRVIVMWSRKNSMEKCHGWHFILTLDPSLSWDDAKARGITGEHLTVVWKTVESIALVALLEDLPQSEVECLSCRTASNSKGSATRDDCHAYVLVTSNWDSVPSIVDVLEPKPRRR